MSKALAKALAALSKAESKINDVLKRDYPLNASVEWARNGNTYQGIVILHSYGDRIKVRNVQSGNELWITAYHIVEAKSFTE